MANEIFFENCHGFATAAGRVQCHRVDVGVSSLVGIKLGRFAELGYCPIGLFQPHECQSERIVKPCILGTSTNHRAQKVFAITIATKASVARGDRAAWSVTGTAPTKPAVA